MRFRNISLILAALMVSAPAFGQLTDAYQPGRSACCLPGTARNLADQLQDWNMLGRYYAANQDLKKQPADPKRVVFMGDSITDFWGLAEYFPGKPYVNRGIGGQTTPQMVVRMYPDVIDLKPAAVIILAGTNDIARNTGISTAEMVQQNIMAMTMMAQQAGIKVVLCSVIPVSDYPFLKAQSAPAAAAGGRGGPGQGGGRGGGFARQQMTTNHPAQDILKLNAWMKDYAARVKAVYADYYSAMVDDRGWLKESISDDGLHPNAAGYKVMAPIAESALQKALQSK
jgi:lysophospholipase L1-like esterase